MKKINIQNVIEAQERLNQRSKERKQRFFQLQRELYGAEIEVLRDEQPHLSLWEATQLVYNKYKYGVEPNTPNYNKALLEAKKDAENISKVEKLKNLMQQELGKL